MLATILLALNFVDVLLIIVLDLDNLEVNALPIGPRILAAIFQAASSRHTGTATFNLANVNPAVQFSLLVMMYISIYPIAISIRMSNSYEEQAVGLYSGEENLDELGRGKSYMIMHIRNQLSFDLWYIFLGVFCICCAESKRIMDMEDYVSSAHSLFYLDPSPSKAFCSYLPHRHFPSSPSSSKSFPHTATSVFRSDTLPT